MAPNAPSVSVIIPARDAAATLPRALASIKAQRYSEIIEVVVAAADSPTALAAREAGAEVVDNPAGSTAVGLNRALNASSGEVVVRCDAHAVLPPDYVAIAVSTLLREGAAVVGGMQVPVGRTITERAIAAAMASRLGSGGPRYRAGGAPGPVDTVYLGVFDAGFLREIGGYDERFVRSQDFELNHRIRQAGGVVWFEPRLRVEYRPRGSIRALASQYFQYGQWKRHLAQLEPGTLGLRQVIPAAVTAVVAIGAVGGMLWRPLLAGPLSYLASVLLGSIPIQTGLGWKKLLVPLALVVMHLGWGSGFLYPLSLSQRIRSR